MEIVIFLVYISDGTLGFLNSFIEHSGFTSSGNNNSITYLKSYKISFYNTHYCASEPPDQTPNESPKETPNYTPIITFENTPFITPMKTINESPKETPNYTPIITFENTPMRTINESPKETPNYTPFITCESTPVLTPIATITQQTDSENDESNVTTTIIFIGSGLLILSAVIFSLFAFKIIRFNDLSQTLSNDHSDGEKNDAQTNANQV